MKLLRLKIRRPGKHKRFQKNFRSKWKCMVMKYKGPLEEVTVSGPSLWHLIIFHCRHKQVWSKTLYLGRSAQNLQNRWPKDWVLESHASQLASSGRIWAHQQVCFRERRYCRQHSTRYSKRRRTSAKTWARTRLEPSCTHKHQRRSKETTYHLLT